MRRVFIAINLPNKDKNRISGLVESLKPLFELGHLRWSRPESRHITVSFLGDQDDDAVARIADALKRLASDTPAPNIKIKKLAYGPSERSTRMVWLTGDLESSKTIGVFKEELERSLAQSGVRFQRETRQFMIHITLARFNTPIEHKPAIERDFAIEFVPATIELMESELGPSEAEYSVLVSAPFER